MTIKYRVLSIDRFLLVVILTLVMSSACSKKINVQPSITDFLPGQTGAGLERTSQIRQYNRENLWDYLDGGADLYLDHGFVALATADYRKHDLEFAADIYQFDSPEKASELYGIIRPPDAGKINIGQDGYLDAGQLTFLRGSYIVRLTGYVDTDVSQQALENLADAIQRRLQIQQDGMAK